MNFANMAKHVDRISLYGVKDFVRSIPVFLLTIMTLFGSAQTVPKTPEQKRPFQVKVSGSGRTAILFLPGFACSGAVWDETLKSFGSRYTCHIFTMAGFAGAPAEEEPVLTSWVDALAAYIRDKGLEKPIVIGHSLGGIMALLLSAQYPELVSRIVVVDALPCLNALSNPGFTVQADPHCELLVERMRKTPEDQFLESEKRIVPGMIADTIHRADIVQWGMQSDRKTYASIYCQFNNTDLRATIKSIKCPALILLEAPFAQMKSAVESEYVNLPSATIRYATKGLHFIMFDDKEWYFDQLNSFL